MKMVKGIHVNGTDTKKRFWMVPEAFEEVSIRKGQHVIVETEKGEAEIEVLQVFTSKNSKVRFKTYELQVTKKVVAIPEFQEVHD